MNIDDISEKQFAFEPLKQPDPTSFLSVPSLGILGKNYM